MNSSDHYRKRAIELEAVAHGKKDPAARVEWLQMAKAYRMLAELVDSNARLNFVYEPPLSSANGGKRNAQIASEALAARRPTNEGLCSRVMSGTGAPLEGISAFASTTTPEPR